MLICRVFIELCGPDQTGSADILVLARDALLYNPSIPLWKTMINNLQRFESLGDNCEFAFFLRESGYDEGSLFRWTLIKNYHALLKLIESDFADLYVMKI